MVGACADEFIRLVEMAVFRDSRCSFYKYALSEFGITLT
jgi:hypothetical protein